MRARLRYNSEYDALHPKEKKLLEKLTVSIREFVLKSPTISKVFYKTRDAHATTYNVLEGKFMLHENSEHLSIFPEKIMDVTLRISNAHLKIVKGKWIPAYGFSLKLKHGAQTVANFPLVNFPLFPFNNVTKFLRLFTAINQYYTGNFFKKISNGLHLIWNSTGMFPEILHPSFIKNAVRFIKSRNNFILSFSYHSIGVYRFGNHLVKLKLVPEMASQPYSQTSPDVSVEEYMAQNRFFKAELFIQYAYDLKNQPVNQLHREWKDTPYVSIGLLHFDSIANKKDLKQELLSFNPFENIDALQPVGKIQQLRKRAYEASFKARSEP